MEEGWKERESVGELYWVCEMEKGSEKGGKMLCVLISVSGYVLCCVLCRGTVLRLLVY